MPEDPYPQCLEHYDRILDLEGENQDLKDDLANRAQRIADLEGQVADTQGTLEEIRQMAAQH